MFKKFYPKFHYPDPKLSVPDEIPYDIAEVDELLEDYEPPLEDWEVELLNPQGGVYTHTPYTNTPYIHVSPSGITTAYITPSMCGECGAQVMNTDLHKQWHKSLVELLEGLVNKDA